VRTVRALSCGVFFLVLGCSEKSPITSKRSALEPRLTALRDARKTAAAFTPGAAKPADVAAVVSRKAPYDDSNVIVIIDEEIDAFDREVDCTALAKTGRGVNCSDGRFGAGNTCAMEAASVLKFGHFRDQDTPHARSSVERCAEWLPSAKYALVVHIDSESSRGATAETYAKGYAVLVELASGKPLGRITFDVKEHEELGGETFTKSGQKARYVTKDATSADTLVRNALAEQLVKTFPSAKVDRWASSS
jgi:hypothetical protein